eukprot:TRINITY_DN35076_c0_g1_i1.p1 TRINITY_DN35076_c0_g1~~TRINITY_DN35076_c0_g1_i1.p1  ORF type:complete len:126 (-),score=33.76 TRINITY_DN35076_c0_g1_i1:44-421(-)
MGREQQEQQERFDASVKVLSQMIDEEPCLIFSTTFCPWCDRAKELFEKAQKPCRKVELDVQREGEDVQMLGYSLSLMTNQRTVPNIFLGGMHVGGFDRLLELQKRCKNGNLDPADRAKLCPLVTE